MALPASITPSTPLGSDLKSDGDNQIRALKQFIVDVFGVPANTPINNAAFAITTGGLVTMPQAVALSSTLAVTGATTLGSTLAVTGAANIGSALTVAGTTTLGAGLGVAGALTIGSQISVGTKIYINESANSAMTQGLTINGGAVESEVLAFKSTLHIHGMTDYTESDTYAYVRYFNTERCGYFQGWGESLAGVGLQGAANSGTSLKSATADAPIILNSVKRSGTGHTALGANENLLAVRNQSNTRLIVDADGDLHLDGVSNANAFDDYDDLKLLTAARASLMPDCDFKERFADWIEEYAPVLAQGKIITYNDDGHHFVSYKGMQGLIIDTIRQLGERIECLEQPKQTTIRGGIIKSAWRKLSQRLKPAYALARVRS